MPGTGRRDNVLEPLVQHHICDHSCDPGFGVPGKGFGVLGSRLNLKLNFLFVFAFHALSRPDYEHHSCKATLYLTILHREVAPGVPETTIHGNRLGKH